MPFQPIPAVAAAAIVGVCTTKPPEVANSPEPYRAAACALGWECFDGTPWWDEVMDLIG